MKLSTELFKSVVANTPLISIDLVVYSPQGQVLLGERLNRPAQGFWFVPGGRIFKDEKIPSAFQRLTQEELGQTINIEQAEFIGPFEHHYNDSALDENVTTHYVVQPYTLILECDLAALPSAPHGQYQWFDVADCKNRDDVHLHTKWYL